MNAAEYCAMSAIRDSKSGSFVLSLSAVTATPLYTAENIIELSVMHWRHGRSSMTGARSGVAKTNNIVDGALSTTNEIRYQM